MYEELETYDPESYQNLRSWLQACNYPEKVTEIMGEKFSVDIAVHAEVNALRDALLMHILLNKYLNLNPHFQLSFESDDGNGYRSKLGDPDKYFYNSFGKTLTEAFVNVIIYYNKNKDVK